VDADVLKELSLQFLGLRDYVHVWQFRAQVTKTSRLPHPENLGTFISSEECARCHYLEQLYELLTIAMFSP
jgi:hypothetical protein